MPPLVAIAVGSIFTAAGAGLLTVTVGGFTILGASSALFGVGASLIYGGAKALLTPKGTSSPDLTTEARGRQISVRQSAAPWRVIYGRLNVGGAYSFMHETGTKNEFVNLIITLTGHEVEEIEKVRFNGEEVPLDGNGDATGTYAGYAHVEFGLGDPDQVAYANLISAAPTKWTTDHRQRNRANAYVKLKWNQEIFPNGIPNITFDIKGRKVYDPRLGYTVYSTNPALCLADFLSLKENFLRQSRNYDHANWVKFNILSIATDTIVAPDGTTTADRITPTVAATDARIWQNAIGIPAVASREVVMDTWVKAASGTPEVAITINNQNGSIRAFFLLPLTTSWQNFQLSVVMDPSDTAARAQIGGGASWLDADGPIDWWETNFRYGSVKGPSLHTGEFAIDGSAFGLENTWEEIDEDELIAQANICDEDVALSGGGTEDRYTCNGSFLTSEKPNAIIKKMLTAMGGTPTYIGGKWAMLAAAWRAPTVSLDENDLRGSMQVQSRISRRELFNAMRGIYVSETNKWQPSDFPPVTSATYEAEDNNERIWKDVEYPFTNTASTAQRLSKIDMQRIRRQTTVRIPCKLSAYQVQTGNVVKFNNTRFGWTDKTFEVANNGLVITEDDQGAPAYGVDLILRQTDANVYAWSAEDVDAPPPPSSDLPGPKLFPGAQSQFPPDSDLRVHFSFDAGDGNFAYGRGQDAVRIPGSNVSAIEGISGKGIQCDDADGRFDNGSDFVAGMADYTLSFWTNEGTGTEGGTWRTMFKSSVTARHHVLVRQSGPPDEELGVYKDTFFGCGFLMSSLSAGQHHITAVGHDSQTDFYVDSEFVGTANAKITDGIQSIGNLEAGGQSWGAFDEARVYGRVLTEEEITSLYLNPQGAQTLDNVPDGFDRYGAHQLMRNPDFEVGDRDWVKGTGFTIENDPANAYDGDRVGKFVGTAQAAISNPINIAVQPGDVLMANCMTKRTAGDGNTRVRIVWRDASKTDISASAGNNITSSSYALSRVVATAPAGAFFAVVQGFSTGMTVSQTAYYDQFQASFFPQDLDDVEDSPTFKRIQTGTIAGRPAAGTVGRYYHATDTDEWFRDNGTSWDLISGRSVENESQGTTAAPLASGTPALMPEMQVTYIPKTDKVLMIFSSACFNNDIANNWLLGGFHPYLSGVAETNALRRHGFQGRSGTTDQDMISFSWLFTGLTPGVSKNFQVYWYKITGTGFLLASGTERSIQVEDIL